MLTNAWAGYNCSLFAYGQTGSGKSYSIVGYASNKGATLISYFLQQKVCYIISFAGIVPVACEELFKGIEEKRQSQTEGDDYRVFVSMLEIYNEKVRDLLTTKVTTGGLKVNQHPKEGFYGELKIKMRFGIH